MCYSVTLLDGLAVEEPLHLERGVGDRNDPGLEVNLLALLHLNGLGRGGEDGGLGGRLLYQLGPGRGGVQLASVAEVNSVIFNVYYMC